MPATAIPRTSRRNPAIDAGFTLLELLIAVAIVTVLASLAIPQYQASVTIARSAKAKAELKLISTEIQVFLGVEGRLPLSLVEIGRADRLDPWGQPYVYLNLATGTGDNLQYAVDQGVLDPSAVASGGGGGGGSGRARAALNAIQAASERRVDRGGDPIPALERLTNLIGSGQMSAGAAARFSTVDDVMPVRRVDGFLFPINTDFELFSLGPNRTSAQELLSIEGRDDVIRAQNGGFFGIAGTL